MLALFILVPLTVLALLNLPYRTVPRKAAVTLGVLVCSAQAALVVARPAGVFEATGFLGNYFNFAHGADGLSLVMLLSIGIVMLVAIIVAANTMADPRRLVNFVSVALVALAGMNGVSFITDLFSLYVFLEIVAVASFVLIAIERGREALEGAFKYILLSAVASALMLTGIALLVLVSGSTDFSSVATAIRGSSAGIFERVAIGALLCGLFIKGGLVPFHAWVPGAYASAPAATSILLAGIGTKISGIYALIRLVGTVFGPISAVNEILLFVGALSIVVGALAALGQNNLKWLLSYSSISQVGYIILGLGCGTTMGLIGAIFHFFNHAVLKSLLFANSAALEERLGTTEMSAMGGLGARMPVTSVTSSIGALSTAGVPPLSGFWSKLIIIIALWQAGFHVYAVIAILASVLTLGYMLAMQRKIFFGTPSPESQSVTETRFGIVLSEVILAAVTVAVGLAVPFAPYAYDALKSVVESIR